MHSVRLIISTVKELQVVDAPGGAYCTPMIDEGAFITPSVFMNQEEDEYLREFAGQQLNLLSKHRA